MKKLILAGVILAGSLGVAQLSVPQASAQPVDCSLVRCVSCPEGQHLALKPPHCCRCLPD
jgi:hypothetical protein